MIKLLCAFACAHLAWAATSNECVTLRDYVETACDYKNPLKITSSPDKIVLEKNNCNVEFDKTKWQQKPSVQYPSANPDKTYTIVCMDPDAPQHKKGEYYLHWIGINVPGKDLATGDVSKGTNIKPYKGPGPPKGTGIHRYIFLIFEESEKNQAVENTKRRQNFSIVQWVQSQPKKLCGPVAGLQFTAKFEKP